MIGRKVVAFLVAALAAVAATPAGSLARAHHGRAQRVSGVVTAINPLSHTLALRVKHARPHAAGAQTLTISFGSATVNGPDGAVAVGDSVRVTLSSNAVASSINVVGEPNGGTSGNGAAIPGIVAAVDPTTGLLTLEVSSAAGGTRLTVTVSPSTIIAVSDATGVPSLASIHAGDRVLVFTDDMTADPLAAIAILDTGQPSEPAPPSPPPSGTSEPSISVLSGTVETVGTESFTVKSDNDGAFPEQLVTVNLTASTQIAGRNSSGDTVTGIGGLENGDQIELYYRTSSSEPVVAYKVADDGALVTTAPAPPPSTSSSGPSRFGGTVTAVRGDGLTVAVGSGGPLAGQTVIVAVSNSTSFETPHGIGDGLANLAYISVDDPVEIYTDDESATPVVAVGVVDDSAPAGSES
jgi:hypothetical protein